MSTTTPTPLPDLAALAERNAAYALLATRYHAELVAALRVALYGHHHVCMTDQQAADARALLARLDAEATP